MKRIALFGLALAAATTILPMTAAHADPVDDLIETLTPPTCPYPLHPFTYVYVDGHEVLVCI